jgi:hypothetical protein
MPNELFGRRIRVTLGDIIVCDLDPFADQETNEGRNLDVTFSVSKHTRLEPMPTTVSIWGLNRDTRAELTSALNQANQTAWKRRREIQRGTVDIVEGAEQAALESLKVNGTRVVVEAGYGDDFGILAVAQVLPKGLEHDDENPGWRTDIEAQDSRFLWSNAFVSDTVQGTGITLYDYQKVLDASAAVQSGEEALSAFTEAFGNLTQVNDLPGHKNGFVLHGQYQENQRQLSDVLGLRPSFDQNGELRFLNPQQTIAGPAVVLSPETGLLRLTPRPNGGYNALSLLNYRIRTGTQIQLFDVDKNYPQQRLVRVSGVFRVDEVTHTGSSFGLEYYSECVLRDTSIKPTANL